MHNNKKGYRLYKIIGFINRCAVLSNIPDNSRYHANARESVPTEMIFHAGEMISDATEMISDTTETVSDPREMVSDITEVISDVTEMISDIAEIGKTTAN